MSARFDVRFAQAAKQPNGFSFAEVLIVLVIIALAVNAIVLAVGNRRQPLRAIALQLVSELNGARMRAITADRQTTVIVNRTATGYRVEGNPGEIHLPGNTHISYSPLLGAGRAIPHSMLAYYGDGSASGGQFTLSDGRAQYMVRVDWLSGAASISAARR